MLKDILEYQKIDVALFEIERGLINSAEFKEAHKMQQFLKQCEESLSKMEKQSAELLGFFNQALKAYDATAKRALEVEKAASTDEKAIGNFNKILDEISKLEKSINALNKNMVDISKKYDDIAKKSTAAKKAFLENRQAVEQKKKDKAGEITRLQTELKAASAKVSKDYLEKYKALRKENKVPAYVELLSKKKCGGCRMDLALNKLDKLKEKGSTIECEHCKRIVYNF
ncbi:MAG: C4-type zinc ribbon domain-containing protein [Firmicutes bacterium]|nr:C4-type zinc ribbon domain-containing protein [Bacillota bacterium]